MQCTRTPYTPCLRVPPHVFHHSAQHLQAGPRNYGRAPATPDPEAGGCAEADKQSGCAGGGVGAPGWCRRICTRGAALRPSLRTRRSQRRPWGAALCWRTPPSQARSPLLGAPLHSAAAEAESPSACIVPFTCAVRSPARICSVSLTAPLVDAPSPLAPAMAVELVKAESIRRRSAEAPPASADMVASDAADSLTLPSRQHADTFHSDYFLSESLKLWVSRTIMVVSPAIRLRGTPVAAGRLAASRTAGRRGGGRRRRRRVWPCSATCGSIGCL